METTVLRQVVRRARLQEDVTFIDVCEGLFEVKRMTLRRDETPIPLRLGLVVGLVALVLPSLVPSQVSPLAYIASYPSVS
jgi:hypothetical protein